MSLNQSPVSGDAQGRESLPSHPKLVAPSAVLEDSAAAPGVWFHHLTSCPNSERRAPLAGPPKRGVSSLIWRGSLLVHSSARHSSC